MKRPALVAVTLILSVLAFPATAQDSKEAAIRELIEITGTRELTEQSVDLMADAMRDPLILMLGDIGNPEKIADIMVEELRRGMIADVDQFIEQAIPIYDRHLSEADINALLTFYRTEEGARSIQSMPAILNETTALGAAWGQATAERLLPEVIAKLEAEGLF